MKKQRILILLTSLILLTTCTNNDEKSHCQQLYENLLGTYVITVTSYPLQRSQEGEDKEVLVFPPRDCNGLVLFNNLFQFFNCDEFPFTEGKNFTVLYSDGALWNAAPVQGKGSIHHGIFHFEGTVNSRGTEYLIILDGKKSTDFMRTSAC
jgi:hypothetical protein